MLPEAAAQLQQVFGWAPERRWPSESRDNAATSAFKLQVRPPVPGYKAPSQPEYAPFPNKYAEGHSDALEEYSRVIPGAAPLVTKIREQMKGHPQLTRMVKLLVPVL